MLRSKKIFLVLLLFSLVFAFASCGGGGEITEPCETCVDADYDGICDVCEKEMPEEEIADVPLFEDGDPTFQIVLGKNVSVDVRQVVVSSIKNTLRDEYDVNVQVVYEEGTSDTEIDIEILIGDVSSRGDEYYLDGHTLGKNGYVVKIIDQKILINAGSDDTLAYIIEMFAEDVLMKDDITDLVMTKDDMLKEIQEGYRITALKVDGTDMRGYTIAAGLTDKTHKAVATALQDSIYAETGYWLDLVDIELATDRSIVMKHVEGVTGEESYKVYTSGSQLIIECAFDNMFEAATIQFSTKRITAAQGVLDFKGTVYTQDISVVYYDDFGAVGDGVTDDFLAIYNAHVFANESGQTVKASRNPEGKAYYIYDTKTEPGKNNSIVRIPIRTNTDWQNVRFIIDDTDIPTFTLDKLAVGEENMTDEEKAAHEANYRLGRYNIFEILPDDEHKSVSYTLKHELERIVAEGLNPDTEKINLSIAGWNGALMIIPVNSEHKVFRRRGSYSTLQSEGASMSELIVIDKDGNVSEETPIMFEYTHLDKITVYKLDPDSAITVGNATIETREARVQNKRFDDKGNNLFSTSYIKRGILVKRSFTTVENINHVITGGYTLKERASGLESSNYEGMFTAEYANHVTFKNCVMPGRQQYDGHSSYNFKATYINKIVLEGCVQSNFWISVDPNEGVMKPSTDYTPGAVPSMSTVRVYDNDNVLRSVRMCWGIGGTNYCKNMEYIDSQLSRFDAHSGLYNGKIINSKINAMELTGYGDLTLENVDWYQYSPSQTLFMLRSDYGYLWNGDLTIKDSRAHMYDTTSAVPNLYIVGHSYTNFYFGYPTVFPNVTVDNLDVYSTKDQTPMEGGYPIHLYAFKESAKQMHLDGDAGQYAIFTYSDYDNNGYIDEPLFDINFDGRINDEDKVDFDGDGNNGNTNLKYAAYAHLDIKELNKGITHGTCKRNLNRIRPPEYIKIINNDGAGGSGGYVYDVVNTAGVSDGGWYRDADAPDTMGGFFGNTKFIYGTGAEDYFYGSDHTDQTKTATFKFVSAYY